MKRRRLFLVAGAGLAAAAALWAYAVWSQYRLEQRFVGTWVAEDPTVGNEHIAMELSLDGEVRYHAASVPPQTHPPDSYWSVSGQEMIVSVNPHRIHRALWPLARLVGWQPPGLFVVRYELTGDRLAVFNGAGHPDIWTRAPAD